MSVVIGNTVRSWMAFPARTHQAPAGSELDSGYREVTGLKHLAGVIYRAAWGREIPGKEPLGR